MCQEPTESRWIGCLTELTWTPKSTKHRLADILSKGKFTRDGWNNLLLLFNISHFNSTRCAKKSSLISCPKTLAKRMQEQKGRKKCGRIEIYSDEPVFSCPDKFLVREKSDCIQRSGDTHSYGETWKRDEKTFKRRVPKLYSVNRSTSKAGSSSCQCSTTLYAMQEEIKNNVNTIHRQLRNTLANSLAVIGLSWGPHQMKKGTEPVLTNQAEEMMENLSRSGHPIFRASSAVELVLRTEVSANQRSNCRFMRRSTQAYQGSGETCSTSAVGKGNCNRPLQGRKFYHCTAEEKPTARIRAKIGAIVRRPEIIQTMFWCGFEPCWTRTILLYSWKRRRKTDATLMPRIHAASQRKGDPCERTDSKQDKNRSSLEH